MNTLDKLHVIDKIMDEQTRRIEKLEKAMREALSLANSYDAFQVLRDIEVILEAGLGDSQ